MHDALDRLRTEFAAIGARYVDDGHGNVWFHGGLQRLKESYRQVANRRRGLASAVARARGYRPTAENVSQIHSDRNCPKGHNRRVNWELTLLALGQSRHSRREATQTDVR